MENDTADARQTIVTNTTPLIALTAATGSLDVLQFLYKRVVVPLEVQKMGYTISIEQAIERMRQHGIWLSSEVIKFALQALH